MRRPISPALREEVTARAGQCCEYCLTPESGTFALHQIDHIVAVKHGGETSLDNLALCCTLCNGRKGCDLASVDPDTGQRALLFHPRHEVWHEHFEFQGTEIVARSASGRATVNLLRLNDADRIKERRIRLGLLWTRD